MGRVDDPFLQVSECPLPFVLMRGFNPWHRGNLARLRIDAEPVPIHRIVVRKAKYPTRNFFKECGNSCKQL
jgi:hypothetical protein